MYKINCLAFPDLNWVCEKCLHKIAQVSRYTVLDYRNEGYCQKCKK